MCALAGTLFSGARRGAAQVCQVPADQAGLGLAEEVAALANETYGSSDTGVTLSSQ